MFFDSVTKVTNYKGTAIMHQYLNNAILSEALKKCKLFENMTMEELSDMLECLKPKIKKIGKNEIANIQGDDFDGLGVVMSGQAVVVKEDSRGNSSILGILRQGDIFGEMAAFTNSGKWPATIVAQTECIIMYIPAKLVTGVCEKLCKSHQTLNMNMLRILAEKAMILSRKLEYLSVKSIRGRIAKFLLEQKGNSRESTFMLPMNRNELADFLNVARPSLSREMCRMRDEGLIDFHRSSVKIIDVERLKESII